MPFVVYNCYLKFCTELLLEFSTLLHMTGFKLNFAAMYGSINNQPANLITIKLVNKYNIQQKCNLYTRIILCNLYKYGVYTFSCFFNNTIMLDYDLSKMIKILTGSCFVLK